MQSTLFWSQPHESQTVVMNFPISKAVGIKANRTQRNSRVHTLRHTHTHTHNFFTFILTLTLTHTLTNTHTHTHTHGKQALHPFHWDFEIYCSLSPDTHVSFCC